jgi:hypothetical protein
MRITGNINAYQNTSCTTNDVDVTPRPVSPYQQATKQIVDGLNGIFVLALLAALAAHFWLIPRYQEIKKQNLEQSLAMEKARTERANAEAAKRGFCGANYTHDQGNQAPAEIKSGRRFIHLTK